jgi:hypothetical protein
VKRTFDAIGVHTVKALKDLAPGVRISAQATINEAVKAEIGTVGITASDAKKLATKVMVDGKFVEEWIAEQTGQTINRVRTTLRRGVLAGETNQEIVRRLRGRRTNKTIVTTVRGKKIRQPVYEGGVLDITTRHADTMVRTAVNALGNEVNMEVYKANADIVKGVQTVTTLDSRTSDICMARTGAAWDMETGKPLPGSTRQEQFPGPPPYHPNCRTVLIPIVRVFDDISDNANRSQRKKLDAVGERTRASVDGQVSSRKIKSFDDYLELRGDEFARKKLGPKRFEAWKDGRLTTAQLIN